jgi:multimeric flavodoxin WrbA
MSAICINGSPNRHGRTSDLCKKIGVPIVHLGEGIPLAVEEIKKADAVVFVTPVHWFNVSHLMNELFYQMPEGPKYPFEGKTAYFIAVCDEDGGQQAINQMFAAVNHMGFAIPPYACNYYNNNMARKSEGQWQLKFVRRLRRELKAFT